MGQNERVILRNILGESLIRNNELVKAWGLINDNLRKHENDPKPESLEPKCQ
jgi:hypothetical protein